jgi:probable HAF family extracellular repeat protein
MRTHVILVSGLAVLLCNFSYSHERAPAYRVFEIHDANAGVETGVPRAMNDLGSVTGEGFAGPEGPVPFLWSHGLLSEIPSDGIIRPSEGLGINDRGQVVGISVLLNETGLDQVRGFVWSHGKLMDIGDLPGGIEWSIAYGINNRGQVVGASEATNGREAVLWDHGHLMSLGNLPGEAFAINDWTVIVGQGQSDTGNQAFSWRDGVMSALPVPTGTNLSAAVAVNNFNVAAGYVQTGDSQAAVIWKDGKLKLLPYFSSEFHWANANAINNRGDVVGTSSLITPPKSVATLWHRGVAYNLNDLIADDDPLKACVDLRFGQAVNDRGQIAVGGANLCENDGVVVFILSPTRKRE